jgi:hypothetical protein
MKTVKSNLFLAAFVSLLTVGHAPKAGAHHSTLGRFSENETIELQGKVSEISWRNPHSLISVEVSNGGKTETWEVEAVGMTALRRSGLDLDGLKVGDQVSIGGPASMLGKTETFLRYLVIEREGARITYMGNPPGTPVDQQGPVLTGVIPYMENGAVTAPELGLFRVWVTAGFVPIWPTDDAFPLTEAAKAKKAAFNPVTDNPTLNCKPKGMPLIMEQPYPMQFTDRGDTILLQLEEYDTNRVIHMNQSRMPTGTLPSLLGYSRGHWDGTTLVVSTAQIDWPWLSQRGIPLSSEVQVIERFTPTEDGSRLDYTMHIFDPVMFTKPLDLAKHWVYLPELSVETYNCQ